MVAGQNFVAGSTVMFGGVPLATTFASRSQLQATGTSTAAQEGTVQIAFQNPDPGPSTSTHSAGRPAVPRFHREPSVIRARAIIV